VAALLLSVKKNQGDDAYNELVQTFESSLEVLKGSKTFSEIGTAREGLDDDSAAGQFEALAKKYAEEHKVGIVKARKEVARTNRKLYAEAKFELQ